jgi:fucose 4-O-acetylase-like acetyltransferase
MTVEKKIMNDGICLLRLVMAFMVVMCHFSNESGIVPFYKTYAVPVFMLISFYYTSESLVSSDVDRIRKKIIRLLIPFWSWGIIYYIILSILGNKITLADLLWQLVTGSSHTINPPLWFIADQMVLVIFLYSIYSLFENKKWANYFSMGLVIFCLAVEYSGLNYEINNSLPWELKWNVGRFFETLPYAIIGVLLGQVKNKFKLSRLRSVLTVILGIILLWVLYRVNLPNGIGFGYEGIAKVIGTVVIFFVFMLMPLQDIKILERISKYTLGIYCLHLGIGWILQYILGSCNIELRDRYVCVLIYIISLLCAIVISKIPIKNIKKIVN